jgi:hypothetical protein
MNLLTEAMGGLGAALLPVAAGLLLEELTFGGLVRLVTTPWPRNPNRGLRADGSSPLGSKQTEHNKPKGEEK